jgi:coproporphyrinogen III oxidase
VLQRDRKSTIYVARREKNKPYVEGERNIALILQGYTGELNFMLQRYRRKHELA